jgi:serine phosphatase RsbU (regulator of sigma subunit)
MLSGLLSAARLDVPDHLPGLLLEKGRTLGADDVTVYLVDPEQYVLTSVPTLDGPTHTLPVDGTLAGRSFRDVTLELRTEGLTQTAWVPVVDGLERLGVVELRFSSAAGRAPDDLLHDFAALIAELMITKSAYGDLLHRVRRQRPMSLAAEIAWQLLPPLTFGTDRLVIAAALAPAYDVGGDCFDYAVDATTARFALFDAMGHGLAAGLLATVAMGAYRSARRRLLDLHDTAVELDAAIATHGGGEQFVTGLLAELDLARGRLLWLNAGHPGPLLLRSGRLVKTLTTDPDLPLGLGGSRRPVAESLQPADRLLLFTDGVPEARSRDGAFFGVERLADLVVRQEAAEQPAPETMRRLMHAILAHQEGQLQDDATAMLVEWRTGGTERAMP